MNIFVLNKDPALAAQDLCDKHLSKMLLESCQLMCTAKNILAPNLVFAGQYKSTHVNHPCAIWTRTSYNNFLWLFEHAGEIGRQYSKVYNKSHKCEQILYSLVPWIESDYGRTCFPSEQFTEQPKCMPDEFKDPDVVKSYQNYYIGNKARFAKWKNRPQPIWWPKDIV